MGKNSVYAALDTDSIVNEVRLTLSSNPNTPFLIVEGEDDVAFFRHHCLQSVIIRESFNEKSGVSKVIEVFIDKKSVVGICDRDYDDAQLPSKMFSYDYSCLETMLLANDKTSEVVFTQLELRNRISLTKILSQLLGLSYLRKMNFTSTLAIRFDGLSVSKLFDSDCGIAWDKLMSELQRINDNVLILNTEQIIHIKMSAGSAHSIDDLLFITQGHDLISLIQCYHRHHVSFKGRTMSEGNIRALLYCTYVEKFNTSKLYNDVLRYGEANSLVFWAA